jgi:hypothetical protein
MRESSKLVEPAASKSWITELIWPDPVGDEVGTAIAYEYPETRFYMGTIVEKRPLCSCGGVVERTRSGALCNRSICAWRPCCDATTQLFICVPI